MSNNQYSEHTFRSVPQSPSLERKDSEDPQITTIVIRIPSCGPHFLCCGPSKQYSTVFPYALRPFLLETDFQSFLQDINAKLIEYWPPQLAINLGYICSILTAGLSCILPLYSLQDTQKYMEWIIDEYNIKWEQKNVKIKWKRHRLKTWIQFTVPDQKNLTFGLASPTNSFAIPQNTIARQAFLG